ncbi:protoglobin domain-containing protein [uncultured Thermanaerothrix sp.]|uniref:protoglobin domain-containing protein n=1 Tax=uncultured Thermanaerothrix sp. TaxID=1195149 RepID=UPI00261F4414|nr:protoglobin domain-containing protein [uncultured Thermanaerothrix sp.]
MVTKDLTWQVATSVAPEGQAQIWELRGLDPSPEETWDHLRAFLHLDEDDLQAMLGTIEPLFQRGYDLIVENYAYLEAFPETAALLGWSGGADPQHLAERRRFFAVWLARTLGLDFSHDFARYLFRAGQVHAGHGRRRLHIPSLYVVGSIALMTAAFARILEQAEVRTDVQLRALAGWNKVFILHLQMMLQGYRSALALTEGEEKVKVTVYGRLRSLIGCDTLEIGFYSGQSVLEVLRKFFNYYPHARSETLEIVWESQHHDDARGNPWMEVERIYRPRAGWRVLRNGRDIAFMTEDQWRLEGADQVAIFPPGR